MGVEHETEIDLTDDVMDQDTDIEDRGDELTEDQVELWERDEAEEAEDADDDTDDEAHDDNDPDDEHSDYQGDADAGGDQHGTEQKGSRIVPHARFNEVNEQYKQEREARLRLEEELARLRGLSGTGPEDQAAEQEQDQAQEDTAFDFDEAEGRYNEAIYDGDVDEAKKIRAEIRAAERLEAENAARAVLEQERAQIQAQNEQRLLQETVEQAYQQYPFLDPDSKQSDPQAINAVVAMRNMHMGNGMSAAEAIAKAVDEMAPLFGGAVEGSGKGGRKPMSRQSKETLERNLERADRIPPTAAGVGERARKVDYASLSEEEFASLPENEKRRARGDFL